MEARRDLSVVPIVQIRESSGLAWYLEENLRVWFTNVEHMIVALPIYVYSILLCNVHNTLVDTFLRIFLHGRRNYLLDVQNMIYSVVKVMPVVDLYVFRMFFYFCIYNCSPAFHFVQGFPL